MKKRILCFLILIMIAVNGSCFAAAYTLPEKMYNQLAIGSGLKGKFLVKTEGEKFQSRFVNSITDAEFSIRGISSGKDLHYYVFQGDEKEPQSAVSELYRKDGVYYFRSSMVEGKTLVLPAVGQFLETIFPAEGENGSAASFVSRIMSLSEEERKEKWEPVLMRFQNELEFWLADFAVDVKLESGSSALDFSYEIPADKVVEKTVELIGQISKDSEASALLSTVMTDEEKNIYLNPNLLYFYREALNPISAGKPVVMKKRVSAMGEILQFSLELPLDEKTTGYQSLLIEMINNQTVYTLRKTGHIYILAIPDIKILQEEQFTTSVWFAHINSGESSEENFSVRADISKTYEAKDENKEKSHEIYQYTVNIENDTTFIPEDIDRSSIPEADAIRADITLHYSSKYAQNNATTLEILADMDQSGSALHLEGTFKTSSPWIFMPFEIVDPIQPGKDWEKAINEYIEDWISNAEMMIRHDKPVSDDIPVSSEPANDIDNEKQNHDGEHMTEQDAADEAEAKPID